MSFVSNTYSYQGTITIAPFSSNYNWNTHNRSDIKKYNPSRRNQSIDEINHPDLNISANTLPLEFFDSDSGSYCLPLANSNDKDSNKEDDYDFNELEIPDVLKEVCFD